MIRKLTENDRKIILDYLYQDPSLNIFIIGDIENFGFETDFQTIYGEFIDNTIKSVILFYRENVIYYSHLTEFNHDYLEIMKSHNFSFISGAKRLVDLIRPHYSHLVYKPMYFAEARQLENYDDYSDIDIKIMSNEKEAAELYDLLVTISEFSIDRQTKEEFIDNKMASINTGPTYLLYIDNIVVSTVATTAETTKSAMVVGVATHPNYRKKGYASKLMTALMEDYFNNIDKYLCLFYDNPKAGAIYRRLGFKDIDKWVMLDQGWFNEKSSPTNNQN